MRTIRVQLRTGRLYDQPHVASLSSDEASGLELTLDDMEMDEGPAWDTWIDVDVLPDGTVLDVRKATERPNRVTVVEPEPEDEPA